MKRTYEVIRVSTGSNNGTHKSFAAAEKRISRLVAMSNGKLTRDAWEIKETMK